MPSVMLFALSDPCPPLRMGYVPVSGAVTGRLESGKCLGSLSRSARENEAPRGPLGVESPRAKNEG
jgi:hypothetical protein